MAAHQMPVKPHVQVVTVCSFTPFQRSLLKRWHREVVESDLDPKVNAR